MHPSHYVIEKLGAALAAAEVEIERLQQLVADLAERSEAA